MGKLIVISYHKSTNTKHLELHPKIFIMKEIKVPIRTIVLHQCFSNNFLAINQMTFEINDSLIYR